MRGDSDISLIQKTLKYRIYYTVPVRLPDFDLEASLLVDTMNSDLFIATKSCTKCTDKSIDFPYKAIQYGFEISKDYEDQETNKLTITYKVGPTNVTFSNTNLSLLGTHVNYIIESSLPFNFSGILGTRLGEHSFL